MPNRIEEAASKTMGKLNEGKAALAGLKGVFRHLAEEHGEVTALLLRVKTSSDVDVRAKLFPEICKELLSHEKGELRVIYPALREHPDTQSIAEEHELEAGQLETLLEQLSGIGYDNPSWKTSFDALVEMVKLHTSEEEKHWFPAAQKALGERTEQLLSLYERAKAEAKNDLV